MLYIKISSLLFLISLCLLLTGLFAGDINASLIISGVIMNYAGLAILFSGAIKKQSKAE